VVLIVTLGWIVIQSITEDSLFGNPSLRTYIVFTCLSHSYTSCNASVRAVVPKGSNFLIHSMADILFSGVHSRSLFDHLIIELPNAYKLNFFSGRKTINHLC